MPQLRHSTHIVTLEVPYDRAFDYLSDWRSQAEWGTRFVKGVRKEGEQIILTTPDGDVPVQWRTNRELGTIDTVFPGDSVLPSRLTAIGDSLVYTFTFSLPADVPDEVFHEAQQNMDYELNNLKSILEK